MSTLGALGPAAGAALSYGFAVLGFIAFGVQLAFGWRGGLRASVLLAAVVTSALWAAAGLGYVITGNTTLWSVCRVLDLVRMSAWSMFLMLLVYGARARGWRALPRSGVALLAALSAAALALPAAMPGVPIVGTSAHRFGYGCLLGISVFALVLIEQALRNAPEVARWTLKPLCLGLGGAFIYNVFLYADASLFSQLDPVAWSAHAATQALVIPLLAIAAARNREWTIDIHMSRQVVFHSTALLGSGIYLLAAAAIGYYVRFFGGTWGATLQIALFFGALVLLAALFLSATLRAKLKVYVAKNFFSYRYDYRKEWLQCTRLLGTQEAGSSLEERVIRALANLVESPGGALWLKDAEGAYRQVRRWNMAAVNDIEAADSPFIRFFAKREWVLNVAEVRLFPERYIGVESPAWLETLPAAWVACPLSIGESLIGFVVLATPRIKVELNWEVLDLLKTTARQAASYLAQAQADEALLEARKFEAFNRMSAFVVHDLKNLIAQLSLLSKNAERHRHNPEFQTDMLATVRHVEGRMNHLLMQLRAGATPVENRSAVDLCAVARRVQSAKTTDATRLTLQCEGAVAALAHEERIEHVLGHLVQNALDATEAGGAVEVRVSAQNEHAMIEVRDEGLGMTPEFVRDRLFKPFQTTKSTGMGIGAYESAQYLASIGGRIEVDSRPGEGTRIRALLPLAQSSASVPSAEQSLPVSEAA